MGHQPQRRSPFLLGRHDLDQLGMLAHVPSGHESDARTRYDRINHGAVVCYAKHDAVFRHFFGKPPNERRAAVDVVVPYEPVIDQIIDTVRCTMLFDVRRGSD